MAIAYYAEDIELPAIKKRAVSGWVKAVAETYGKKTGDISYIFCSDEKILEVNRQYLQHDYYTDIITFDYTEGNKISGDLFISLDTVRTNAETFHTDYNEELHRTIIHGILHLCGINDKGPGEREIMEANENKALAILPEECRGKLTFPDYSTITNTGLASSASVSKNGGLSASGCFSNHLSISSMVITPISCPLLLVRTG